MAAGAVPAQRSSPPRELDPARSEQLRETMGHFCTGVVAVTAIADGAPVGFTCQAFASLSLEPPLVAFAAARTSQTFPRIRSAGSFAANVLAAGQANLARTFARSGIDKFAGVGWRPGRSGAPLLKGALAWAECEIAAEHDAGDHTLVVARVIHIGHADHGMPLTFYRGAYGTLADGTRGEAEPAPRGSWPP